MFCLRRLVLLYRFSKEFPIDHYLTSVVDHKIHASIIQLFFKGVLCNWLVCLACFLPTRLKDDMAKMVIIFLLVFAFFFSGYEHSVANIAVFTLASIIPHDIAFTFSNVLHNLVPVTLGNIVGGSIGVGVCYSYLNNRSSVNQEKLKQIS